MQILPSSDCLENKPSVFTANWPAPGNIHTLISTRHGGVSQGVYASLNVGNHVGDDAQAVAHNRSIVAKHANLPLAYMQQIHSSKVILATEALLNQKMQADAMVDSSASVACAVMTADCLPVLFCNKAGTVVAAAHAGWRGLAAGILEKTIMAMNVPEEEIMAYMGPAIGPDAFEVGQDVWDAFCLQDRQQELAFTNIGEGQYLADIYALARRMMRNVGITHIYGGEFCTVLEREHFFSYRRDGQTGRMVSAIWIEQ